MARVAKPEHKAKGEDAAKPRVNAPTTRLNIAWPFSQIKTEEASKELAELADVVADLLVALEDVLPAGQRKELIERTEALRSRLD